MLSPRSSLMIPFRNFLLYNTHFAGYVNGNATYNASVVAIYNISNHNISFCPVKILYYNNSCILPGMFCSFFFCFCIFFSFFFLFIYLFIYLFIVICFYYYFYLVLMPRFSDVCSFQVCHFRGNCSAEAKCICYPGFSGVYCGMS
jgi:hypothetical protein